MMINMLGMNDVLSIILIVVGLALGLGGGYFICMGIYVSKRSKAEKAAAKIMEEAYSEAKFVKKQANLEAKELVLKEQEQGKEELLSKKLELERREDKIARNEEETGKRLHEAETLKANLVKEKETSERHIKEAEEIKKEATEKLSKLAGLTKEQAKKEIINLIEDEAKKEAAVKVREIEDEIKDTADKKAKNIVSLAIQRCAVDHTSEATVSVVALPNDEVKGKIIGREGRNVRALEAALGVDLIIDDTPEAITVSAFDPIRREIAKISLEKLILDGRIHPARIEEIVEKVRKDIDTTIKEAGELAVLESGLAGIHPEVVKTLGRLKYRTSYGQNVLKHSLEVCFLAGLLASEIGANVDVAKRGGLLHDLGKAVDFEKDGTHVSLGVEIAKKYKESEAVIHCIEAHHGDVPYKTVEAILVQVADAISSSRPGARKESLENYIKRLEQLEGIANGFKGVEKSFAIQAGREVRIIVKPDEVDDNSAVLMAKEIAKKIEAEMEYPGQIKVNVIRETRTSEYAK